MFAVYYISALIFTVSLLTVTRRNQEKLVLFLGALSFGVVGFVMQPNSLESIDTVRFFNTLNETRTYNLFSHLDGWRYLMDDCNYQSVPIIGMILYVISLQDQNGYLNFLTGFIDVGAAFYLIYEQCKRNKDKRTLIVSVACFLCLFNFMASVAGVRNFMVIALGTCVAYKYSKKTSIGALIIYILLTLIHPFALLLLLIYLFSLFYKNKKFIFYLLCIPLLLQHFYQHYIFSIADKFSNVPFFATLSFKSSQYFGDTAYIEASSAASRIRSLLLFIFYLFILIVAIKKKYRFPIRYFGFIIMLTCFTIGAIPDEILFGRSRTALMVAVLPLLCELIRQNLEDSSLLEKGPNIPLIIIGAYSVIALMDNIRAGMRFVVMPMSMYTLILTVVLAIFAIVSLLLSNSDRFKWR